MKWLRLITRQWALIAASLVAAAIVHIVSTLAASEIRDAESYTTLAGNLPLNEVVFAKPVSKDFQPLPFMATEARYAFCRFDASTSLIRVAVTLPDAGWSLSLHAPNGDNFYFVPGIPDRPTDIEIVLESPDAHFIEEGGSRNSKEKALPMVNLADPRGIAILKSPIKGLAYRRQADELMNSFACEPTNSRRKRR